MAKIRMLTSIASPDWGYRVKQVLVMGSIYSQSEIPAAVAEQWIASGLAARVEEEKPPTVETASLGVETASLEAPEVAVTRRGRPSGKPSG